MYSKILIAVLVLWLGLSCVRTINNFTKIYTEELPWLQMSIDQKNKKLFGNDHLLFGYIKAHTKKEAKVVIFSYDAKPYLYGRYILYPTRIIQVSTLSEYEKNYSKYKSALFILYNLNEKDQESVVRTISVERRISSKIIVGRLKS